MKKILLATIFSALTFNTMAQGKIVQTVGLKTSHEIVV